MLKKLNEVDILSDQYINNIDYSIRVFMVVQGSIFQENIELGIYPKKVAKDILVNTLKTNESEILINIGLKLNSDQFLQIYPQEKEIKYDIYWSDSVNYYHKEHTSDDLSEIMKLI